MGNHGKSDLNDVVTPGVYSVRPPAAQNMPKGATTYGVLIVMRSEANISAQLYLPNGGTSLFWRTAWSGEFLEWRECSGSAQSTSSDPSMPNRELS